jgi:hypothetical protein
MAHKGGDWDPASIGAFFGAMAAAIVAVAAKLRSVFVKKADPPPPETGRVSTPPNGHIDTDALMSVISRLGTMLSERDRRIDALELRLRESERLQRQVIERVRELEAELHAHRKA